MNWADYTMIEKIYWVIAIPSTALFLVFLVMSLVSGAGADMDVEGDIDGDGHDGGIGFQFISLKSLLGFFTVFSWAGLAALESGQSNTSSILIAAGSGLAMMFIIAGVFYLMSKVTDDGTLVMSNAINHMGEVYLTIPPRRTGFGKVQIRIQGRLHELEAVTDDDESIATGRLATVIAVENNEILVVKANK